MHELIRLTLPARKVPTGKFVVSEDNEFLIVFKDCIGLFTFSNELNTGTRCEAGESTASPLECRTVQEFLSSIAESSFLTSTWSQRLRRSEQKSPHCNALLVSLHKSGSISFWDVALPLLDGQNVRLAAVDRTYTATFDPPALKARPNFLKSADLSGEYFLLVIAFTDGRVTCATYQAYARQVGVLAVTRVAESELCPPSGGALCVSDVACTNGLLAVAYGTRVLLARVLNHSSVHLLTNLSDDGILKAISGVQIFSNCVYFSSQDGVVARASIPTQMNKNSKLTILTEASTQGGTDFHRFFGGLHLTKNGVYAVFVESTVAPAFCHVASNLVFMSLLPSSKVVEMLDKVSAPMRKNADCLYEVKRLLRRLDCGQMLSPAASTGEGGGGTCSKSLLAFCAGDILNDQVDLSTMELHKIQFRRAVAVTLLEASAKSPDVAQKLQTKIVRLDRILALRQVDHCYRLFLKTEVQRQAQDCILVLRIAALCRRFLQSRGPTEDCDASALCTMLHRATEAVTSIAQKLLTRRFEHSLEDIRPEALLVCPVCRDEFDADLLACACPKGHKFLRCTSTFVPCVDPSFNECPSCRRCSVLLPDRPSQWRKEINGRFCPYCNVRFCIVVL